MTPAKAKPRPTEVTALDAAQQCLDQMRSARLATGKATAAIHAADAEVDAAKLAMEEALDASVRGDDGADERYQAALTRVAVSVNQRAEVQPHVEACGRVEKSARARLQQLRELHLQEFADDANIYTAECAQAAEALVQAIITYRTAWNRAATKWSPLENAIRHRIEAADEQRGQLRDTRYTRREAEFPQCPVTDTMQWRVEHVYARPLAMAPGWQPGDKPPAEDTPPNPLEQFEYDSARIK